jgi:16S rRNA (guanine527-N7)-methyltransferase
MPPDTADEPPDTDSGDSLADVLARHGIELPGDVVSRLDRYRELLWDFNTRLNLTRHTTLEKFVTRDVVDSLALSRQLADGERVLDVGSGGGVPGIVLAILRPGLHVSLIEQVGKKARVLEQMVGELGLDTPVYAERVQDHLGRHHYDTLVVRAVAKMARLLKLLAAHWGSFGRLLLIKGPSWLEERAEARHLGLMRPLELRRLDSYTIPGIDAETVVLQVQSKRP